jgi:hypothetical protein
MWAMANAMQVFPWVDGLKWPQALLVGVTFTKTNEHVRIVAPSRPPRGSDVGAGETTLSECKPLLLPTAASPAATSDQHEDIARESSIKG